jgi:hypothetical protein
MNYKTKNNHFALKAIFFLTLGLKLKTTYSMSRTPSMIALGTKAPEFYLKNMQSGTESFADLKGKRER